MSKHRYMSLPDAAADLGVSPATVRRLIGQGKLDAIRGW